MTLCFKVTNNYVDNGSVYFNYKIAIITKAINFIFIQIMEN